jgi:hypothetical protein
MDDGAAQICAVIRTDFEQLAYDSPWTAKRPNIGRSARRLMTQNAVARSDSSRVRVAPMGKVSSTIRPVFEETLGHRSRQPDGRDRKTSKHSQVSNSTIEPSGSPEVYQHYVASNVKKCFQGATALAHGRSKP